MTQELDMSRNVVRIFNDDMDDEATEILATTIYRQHQKSPNTNGEIQIPLEFEGVKTIEARVSPLRGNLNLVPESLRETFTRVANLQDEWITKTANQHILLHGRPHHQNVVFNDQDWSWQTVNPDPVIGPAAHDYAFVLTNWYDFGKTEEENAEILANPGRFARQLDIISKVTSIGREELAKATLFHCFTTAAKRYWSINDNEKKGLGPVVNPGDVHPNYFIEFAKKIAPFANLKLTV